MPKLSITTAWNEAADFVKRDFGALLTVAAAFIIVPGVAAQILAPDPAPGQPLLTALRLLISLAVVALSLVGALAIAALAMGVENVVGRALSLAFRRLPALLGAALLLAAAAMLLLAPIVLLTGVRSEDLVAPTPEGARRLLNCLLLAGVLLVAIWARLVPVTPVAAAEGGNPIRIIARSWALTGGHYWRLLGFVLAMLVLVLVVFLAAHFVFGALIRVLVGPLDPGTVAALLVLLLTSVVNAALGVFMTAAVARIYVQLAERPTTGV